MCVRCAAAARNISGEAIISQPDRVVLAAPELVEAEPVEVGGEVEVALELQARVLTDGWWGARNVPKRSRDMG